MPHYAIPKVEDLPRSTKGESGRKRIVIVTNLGAHSLEYMGPMQVFQTANWLLSLSGRTDLGYNVEVATTKPGTAYFDRHLGVSPREYRRRFASSTVM